MNRSAVLYDVVSMQVSRNLTLRYSTSFGMASKLFDKRIRPSIYNIYGLVRIADEIADTYRKKDAGRLLQDLEHETYAAIARGYSSNIVVHAFQLTARRYGIDAMLIQPFFASMVMDVQTDTDNAGKKNKSSAYDREKYERYIHGSAEVIGLMCLKVFVDGDVIAYRSLEPGARALGSAYQKVNFLRDLAVDRTVLGRNYFPELEKIELRDFSETSKSEIIADIEHDFHIAKAYIDRLPISALSAVKTSYVYYTALLAILRKTSAADIARKRVRVSDAYKLRIIAAAIVRRVFFR